MLDRLLRPRVCPVRRRRAAVVLDLSVAFAATVVGATATYLGRVAAALRS
jgi:hypothetical protein